MKAEKKAEKPVVKKEEPKKSVPAVKPAEKKHKHRYRGSGGY